MTDHQHPRPWKMLRNWKTATIRDADNKIIVSMTSEGGDKTDDHALLFAALCGQVNGWDVCIPLEDVLLGLAEGRRGPTLPFQEADA